MFNPVDNKPDFIRLEHEVLDFWQKIRAFEKLVEKNRGKKRWSFIDGPITANNPMGVHHGWGRTLKDVYQRYHAMLGYDQRYQNGFDCHGLWVEVEVEKELGFNSKREIEAYGLERFIEACKQRVYRFAGEITEQSKRLGMWMDWDNSYYTMSDENIEHIWYFLGKVHDNGWLYRGTRSMPWCWRCGTSLSQLELMDSYEELTHRSVYLRFPITTPGHEGENLLVWTTTPWTLTANVAAAVHPDLDYAKVRQGDQVYYLSRGTVGRLQGEYQDLGNVRGAELVGLTYAGPFDDLPAAQGVQHRVIPWDEVGEEEGTGIVHIAPGCGAEDFELSRQHNLPVLVPLDEAGNYVQGYGWLTGRHVTEVAQPIFDALEQKGLLYRLEDYTHRYPVCWRCRTELVFRVATEWYIKVGDLRDRLIRANRTVQWIPDYASKRMEDWLNNMGDWNISRKRYWGLVLPFYPCDKCGTVTVARTRTHLRELAVNPQVVDALPELHRPWVDEVKIACPNCGQTVSRIPEVGDAWLDAGIVAYSTLHYLTDRQYWRKWFPADFVTEMREQIRLWFYSMLIMSVVLEDAAPYKTVLTYERVHDELGRPMHKSLGNAIWFDEAVEKMGADIMRWMYCGASITQNMNFGYGIADEVRRRLLTLWNTYSFFVMYANLDGYDPSKGSVPVSQRPELDRWIVARLHELIGLCRRHMDQYDVAAVTRYVDDFVDDLSNWYVRRSRRRFWKPWSAGDGMGAGAGAESEDTDKLAAYTTLYEVLVTLSKLIAPVMPFLAEAMYQNLVRSGGRGADQPESVHHCDYPVADEALVDRQLLADVALTQRVVSVGRAARNKAGIKVRQPLREMVVRVPSAQEEDILKRMEAQILEELNVKRMTITPQVGDLITYVVRPNLPLLGPKYGARLGAIRQALAGMDPAEVAVLVAAGQPVRLRVQGEAETGGEGEGENEVELLPEEVLVDTREKEGYAVAQEGGLVVALDTELDEELLQEGVARDLVRVINDMRKSADFDVSDRITTYYRLAGEGGDGSSKDASVVQGALTRFADYIRAETLSNRLVEVKAESAVPPGAYTQQEKLGGVTVTLGVERDSK
jgi:isoleucyl-tRNA synthetase